MTHLAWILQVQRDDPPALPVLAGCRSFAELQCWCLEESGAVLESRWADETARMHKLRALELRVERFSLLRASHAVHRYVPKLIMYGCEEAS